MLDCVEGRRCAGGPLYLSAMIVIIIIMRRRRKIIIMKFMWHHRQIDLHIIYNGTTTEICLYVMSMKHK